MRIGMDDIYIQYYSELYDYVYLVTMNRADAAYIMQKVFHHADKDIGLLPKERNMAVWLYTCSYTECLEYGRNKKNAGCAELLNDIFVTVDDTACERMLHKKEAAHVLNFIHKQEEPLRSLLLLKILKVLNFIEIGNVINRSEVWCRASFFKMKAKLMDLPGSSAIL